MPTAVANVLLPIVSGTKEWQCDSEEEAMALGERYMHEPGLKIEVKSLLSAFGVDESVIVDEVISLASSSIARHEFLIRTAEHRYYSALRNLYIYREGQFRHDARLKGAVETKKVTSARP